MQGNFYAVGVGPGDPELLTIKAINTIEKSNIIVAPKSGAQRNLALEITKDYLENKKVIEVEMPMIKNQQVLNDYHDKAAKIISEYLDSGNDVSFLTLGDPSVYSTVMYVHKRLTNKGYKTGVISGITSFCAAAASLNTSLCEKNQPLHIIPATYGNVDDALNLDGCKVLMKSGKSIEEIKNKLKRTNAKIVECATMESEKIYDCSKNFDDLPGYFSVVVVPPTE